MYLKLTDEQKLIQKMARDFAQAEVAPIAAEMDEKGEVPFANLRKMGELGLLGLTVPEEYGGAGADVVSYVLALEEISKACASTGLMMAVQNSLVCYPLTRFGTEEQKQKYLVPLATGEQFGAYALTEPSAGSDAASLRSLAVREGDGFSLGGTKQFITNGGFADTIIVFARTDPEKGKRGITGFIVEKGFPGFSVGKEEEKMGLRASNTVELIFDDCRVPAANVLGEEGQGFKIALATIDIARIGIGTQALGIAQAAFEEAVKYAKEREQFGHPIAEFQGIQWMLADMATRIEASRLLLLNAALAAERAKKTGERYSQAVAMAKLFASETATWVTNRAVQIHGGYGYMKEYAVERLYREAKITEIYEGSSEIQRLVIARNILR